MPPRAFSPPGASRAAPQSKRMLICLKLAVAQRRGAQ